MYQYEGHVRYRKKQMKYGYSKLLYGQRNKDETIISVIKRLFGEHITSSRLVITQNRELSLRCIAYNMHRLTNLIIVLMVSTEPMDFNLLNNQWFFSIWHRHSFFISGGILSIIID